MIWLSNYIKQSCIILYLISRINKIDKFALKIQPIIFLEFNLIARINKFEKLKSFK